MSRTIRPRRAIFASVAALAMLAGACGGSDEASDDGASASSADTTTGGADTTTGGADTTTGGADTTDAGGDGATASGCAPEHQGGTLTVGTAGLAAALDPTIALGTGSSGGTELTAVYDTLMRYVPETGGYVPHLASALESNDDLTEWTVTIRDGVKFGNGEPVTSGDIQFSIERLAESTRAAAGLAQEIVGFDIVDDQTITLTARIPNGNIPYYLATEVGMVLNQSIVEERGEGFATDATGAGAGPFEVESFAPGVEIVLTGKDDYWGGPVCLDTLRFVGIPGSDAIWDAFQAGEIDTAFVNDMTIVNEARAAGFEAFTNISGGNGFLMLNNRDTSDTSDVRIRQAIVKAIDTDLIDQRVVDGEGLPTSCIAHPNQAIHPDVPCPEFDPEGARELVAEAMADGWDGTLSLVFRDTPISVENSIVIEALLADVGITSERVNLDPTAWAGRVLAPPYEFDIGEYGLALLDAGPIARMNQFYSFSNRNRSGYGSDEMDVALDALTAALTPEEIVSAMGTVQEIWNRDIPAVILNASEWFIMADTDVHGLIFNRDVTAMFQEAYIDS